MAQITWDDFSKVDIRVGTILAAAPLDKARKPAYRLRIDFGDALGILESSAQITELYTATSLLGKQVMAVVNFPPKQIGHFFSQVLVLGLETPDGVVLLSPERPAQNGTRVS